VLALRPPWTILDMTQRNTGFGRRRKATNALAAAVACGGVGWVARGLDRLLEGDPYQVAGPGGSGAAAGRPHPAPLWRTEAVRRGTGDNWPAGGEGADGSSCNDRGFSNLSKQLSDSPPSVSGVVDVDSEWALE
jgi:hypothetical protein